MHTANGLCKYEAKLAANRMHLYNYINSVRKVNIYGMRSHLFNCAWKKLQKTVQYST